MAEPRFVALSSKDTQSPEAQTRQSPGSPSTPAPSAASPAAAARAVGKAEARPEKEIVPVGGKDPEHEATPNTPAALPRSSFTVRGAKERERGTCAAENRRTPLKTPRERAAPPPSKIPPAKSKSNATAVSRRSDRTVPVASRGTKKNDLSAAVKRTNGAERESSFCADVEHACSPQDDRQTPSSKERLTSTFLDKTCQSPLSRIDENKPTVITQKPSQVGAQTDRPGHRRSSYHYSVAHANSPGTTLATHRGTPASSRAPADAGLLSSSTVHVGGARHVSPSMAEARPSGFRVSPGIRQSPTGGREVKTLTSSVNQPPPPRASVNAGDRAAAPSRTRRVQAATASVGTGGSSSVQQKAQGGGAAAPPEPSPRGVREGRFERTSLGSTSMKPQSVLLHGQTVHLHAQKSAVGTQRQAREKETPNATAATPRGGLPSSSSSSSSSSATAGQAHENPTTVGTNHTQQQTHGRVAGGRKHGPSAGLSGMGGPEGGPGRQSFGLQKKAVPSRFQSASKTPTSPHLTAATAGGGVNEKERERGGKTPRVDAQHARVRTVRTSVGVAPTPRRAQGQSEALKVVSALPSGEEAQSTHTQEQQQEQQFPETEIEVPLPSPLPSAPLGGKREDPGSLMGVLENVSDGDSGERGVLGETPEVLQGMGGSEENLPLELLSCAEGGVVSPCLRESGCVDEQGEKPPESGAGGAEERSPLEKQFEEEEANGSPSLMGEEREETEGVFVSIPTPPPPSSSSVLEQKRDGESQQQEEEGGVDEKVETSSSSSVQITKEGGGKDEKEGASVSPKNEASVNPSDGQQEESTKSPPEEDGGGGACEEIPDKGALSGPPPPSSPVSSPLPSESKKGDQTQTDPGTLAVVEPSSSSSPDTPLPESVGPHPTVSRTLPGPDVPFFPTAASGSALSEKTGRQSPPLPLPVPSAAVTAFAGSFGGSPSHRVSSVEPRTQFPRSSSKLSLARRQQKEKNEREEPSFSPASASPPMPPMTAASPPQAPSPLINLLESQRANFDFTRPAEAPSVSVDRSGGTTGAREGTTGIDSEKEKDLAFGGMGGRFLPASRLNTSSSSAESRKVGTGGARSSVSSSAKRGQGNQSMPAASEDALRASSVQRKGEKEASASSSLSISGSHSTRPQQEEQQDPLPKAEETKDPPASASPPPSLVSTKMQTELQVFNLTKHITLALNVFPKAEQHSSKKSPFSFSPRRLSSKLPFVRRRYSWPDLATPGSTSFLEVPFGRSVGTSGCVGVPVCERAKLAVRDEVSKRISATGSNMPLYAKKSSPPKKAARPARASTGTGKGGAGTPSSKARPSRRRPPTGFPSSSYRPQILEAPSHSIEIDLPPGEGGGSGRDSRILEALLRSWTQSKCEDMRKYGELEAENRKLVQKLQRVEQERDMERRKSEARRQKEDATENNQTHASEEHLPSPTGSPESVALAPHTPSASPPTATGRPPRSHPIVHRPSPRLSPRPDDPPMSARSSTASAVAPPSDAPVHRHHQGTGGGNARPSGMRPSGTIETPCFPHRASTEEEGAPLRRKTKGSRHGHRGGTVEEEEMLREREGGVGLFPFSPADRVPRSSDGEGVSRLPGPGSSRRNEGDPRDRGAFPEEGDPTCGGRGYAGPHSDDRPESPHPHPCSTPAGSAAAANDRSTTALFFERGRRRSGSEVEEREYEEESPSSFSHGGSAGTGGQGSFESRSSRTKPPPTGVPLLDLSMLGKRIPPEEEREELERQLREKEMEERLSAAPPSSSRYSRQNTARSSLHQHQQVSSALLGRNSLGAEIGLGLCSPPVSVGEWSSLGLSGQLPLSPQCLTDRRERRQKSRYGGGAASLCGASVSSHRGGTGSSSCVPPLPLPSPEAAYRGSGFGPDGSPVGGVGGEWSQGDYTEGRWRGTAHRAATHHGHPHSASRPPAPATESRCSPDASLCGESVDNDADFYPSSASYLAGRLGGVPDRTSLGSYGRGTTMSRGEESLSGFSSAKQQQQNLNRVPPVGGGVGGKSHQQQQQQQQKGHGGVDIYSNSSKFGRRSDATVNILVSGIKYGEKSTDVQAKLKEMAGVTELKVQEDSLSGACKGEALMRFGDQDEADRAYARLKDRGYTVKYLGDSEYLTKKNMQ
uniref:RRM domain-containing protein n=1 Tax=Chromera velia CCMP2878 TaxID=1169474 RepID=A0A0G4GI30_9ALVE|eukprot:Cvel_21921.t1-p1 / transcript=Cvel_21921.t1 / gene=Cvel_21921 / organism=Chromera_velia_CCMP2878 / gene_product=hypothetical protein / transcript_product=hypothetical protein / location=Cvel_scaffold2101:21260-30745(-) / protein_length=2118 / sequence_SO=supercontig / SO=protein_coding / is_pseudo=false